MRHLPLVVLGVAVLVAGVYLFFEVRSAPVATSTPIADLAPPPSTASGRGEDRVGTEVAPQIAARDVTPRVPEQAPSLPSTAPGEEQNGDRANPSIDAIMDRANKAYDRADFEDAKALASDVLSKLPTSIRMMRIMVSASCIEGDVAVAQKWFDKLPQFDRDQMKIRCDRYGVTFHDPAQ